MHNCITTCSKKSIYRALKKLDPNTPESTTPAISPDRDLTLGERARIRQMLGDKPLRRGDRLLTNIAAKLGVSPKSVWRSYRTTLSRASSSSRGVRRCHFRAAGMECHHTSNSSFPLRMFEVRLEEDNKRVLQSMGYTVGQTSKLRASGRKLLYCCACHQKGRPSNNSLPGSRVCNHRVSTRSRLTFPESPASSPPPPRENQIQVTSVVAMQKVTRGWIARRKFDTLIKRTHAVNVIGRSWRRFRKDSVAPEEKVRQLEARITRMQEELDEQAELLVHFKRRYRRQTVPRLINADELIIRHLTPFPNKAAAVTFWEIFVKPVVPHLEV